MNNGLRTDFTSAERNTIIQSLRDEYGDQEFSDELILLECQDLWRKGCHCLETECFMPACEDNGGCGLFDWEKRNPEYKDDALAKRLKELRDEAARIQDAEITKSLLAKGYVKVQWKQWNDGEMLKSDVKLYQPGSKDLKADLMEAVENWSHMVGEDAIVKSVNLNTKSGTILELGASHGEFEIWEIIPIS